MKPSRLLLISAAAALLFAGCPNEPSEQPTPAPEPATEAPTPEPTPEATPEPTPEAGPSATLSKQLTDFLATVSEADAAKVNPLLKDAEAIKKGGEEYASSCKHCHGAEGRGDGPVAKRFDPPGSDLSNPARYALMTDGQRFQAMKLGVAGTSQQAFGAAMSDDQVWGILAFCASLKDMRAAEAKPAQGADGG